MNNQQHNANNNVEMGECPICYENITKNNNICITPCGHEFCFTCLIKCMNKNNLCPCCRSVLNENKNFDENDEDEEDDEDFEDNETETINDDDTEDDDDENKFCSLEFIETKLKEKNITYINLLSLLITRFPKNTSLSTKQKLEDDVFDYIDELDDQAEKEFDETKNMMFEDEYSQKNTNKLHK